MPELSQAQRGGLLASPVAQVADAFSREELDRLDAELADVPLEEWKDHVLVNGQPARRRLAHCTHLEARLSPEAFPWVHRRVWTLMHAINDERYGFDVTGLESLRFLVYGVGDRYEWHSDQVPAMIRKISISIQLSDPDRYEGGDFETMPPLVTCSRVRGTGIAIPCYFTHGVTAVTSGTRRSLVARFIGPPMR